jgi:hypothetical protein
MNSRTAVRFERRSFALGDLVKALEQQSLVWGRDFMVVGFREPDHLELVFDDPDIAARAKQHWDDVIDPTSHDG